MIDPKAVIIGFALLAGSATCVHLSQKEHDARYAKEQVGSPCAGCNIVTVDSCEYVTALGGGITHKGNCRFCAARNR